MIIELNSVGSVVDDQTLMVYPKRQDGTIEYGVNGVPLMETCDEWVESLDGDDIFTVMKLIESDTKKG